MKFWKRLRWIASAIFIVVLLGVWLGAVPGDTGPGSANQSPRPAPVF